MGWVGLDAVIRFLVCVVVDDIHPCCSCSPGSLRELAEVGFGSAAPYSINQCPGLGVGVGRGGGG